MEHLVDAQSAASGGVEVLHQGVQLVHGDLSAEGSEGVLQVFRHHQAVLLLVDGSQEHSEAAETKAGSLDSGGLDDSF